MNDQTKIIDFHSHHIPARFELTAARSAPPTQRARWEALARTLSNEDALLKDLREGYLHARVVSILIQLIADAEGHVPHETIMAMNDDLAGLVGRHPGRIHGLASVDAYDGDRSAREAERAIRELGLRGLLVECARGDLLLDAAQTRPTLEVAARLGVPVFAHPIAPQPLTRQMTPYGLIGTLFARGAVNSAALIALVEGGVFSQLPSLRVVFTAQAIGGNGRRSFRPELPALRNHRSDAQECLHRYDAFPPRVDPHVGRFARCRQCDCRQRLAGRQRPACSRYADRRNAARRIV